MNRILCAVDASERASNVVAAAGELARRMGAKLTLFRAVGIPPEFPLDLYLGTESSLHELLVNTANKDLTAHAARIPPGLVVDTLVEVGTPWDAICRAAKKLECDLIMIGSHGYSGLDRVIGTTAAKVVNHADRSVLVVRGETAWSQGR